MAYFIALVSTIFVFGSGFLMISSQISEYALGQRQLSEWVYRIPIAHRGLFQNPAVPENSLAAFQAALTKGYAIELDVHLSADGEAVVFHDHDLARVTGQDGRITQTAYGNMAALNLWGTSEYIPTLTHVLNLIQGEVPLFIEIKNEGQAGHLEEKVYQNLKQYKGPVVILSFNAKTLEWFRLKAPQFYRGQNLKFDKIELTSMFELCRQVLKNCKLSKPHLIVYNSQALPPMVVQTLSWFKPFIAYNVTSAETAHVIKKVVHNIIFENFEPELL